MYINTFCFYQTFWIYNVVFEVSQTRLGVHKLFTKLQIWRAIITSLVNCVSSLPSHLNFHVIQEAAVVKCLRDGEKQKKKKDFEIIAKHCQILLFIKSFGTKLPNSLCISSWKWSKTSASTRYQFTINNLKFPSSGRSKVLHFQQEIARKT